MLGGGQSVQYAGDLSIKDSQIIDLTNLSGTFQCDDENGLLDVYQILVQQGWQVLAGGVKFFPGDGSRPRSLC